MNAYQQAKWNAGKAVISAALAARKGLVGPAAKDLGVNRTEMYRLVRRYGLVSECRVAPQSRGNWGIDLPDRGSVFLRARREARALKPWEMET